MSNDITIPKEALEAAKDAWYAHQHMGTDDRMTAACLAMLEAWPGMWEAVNGAIILPLPQEKSE